MAEPAIRLVWRKIDELIPYSGNAKLHPQEQIDRLVDSFNEFGRIVPAGIDAQGNLIYGHGRILAARQRGDTEVPCIEIEGLSELQRRAFVHADNLLAQSPTDEAVLRGEMEALAAAGFDVRITGFDPAGLRLGEDEAAEDLPFWGEVEQENTEEYEAFVEKFKQKLTTDDVYTPENVYRAVRGWAFEHYELEGSPVVRPFYPGGDYKSADTRPAAWSSTTRPSRSCPRSAPGTRRTGSGISCLLPGSRFSRSTPARAGTCLSARRSSTPTELRSRRAS